MFGERVMRLPELPGPKKRGLRHDDAIRRQFSPALVRSEARAVSCPTLWRMLLYIAREAIGGRDQAAHRHLPGGKTESRQSRLVLCARDQVMRP